MHVLLLKSASEWVSSVDDDPYVETLKSHGFIVNLIETLDFVYKTSALLNYKNWRENHSCVIFTSPRAVNAYVKAGLTGRASDLCFVVGPSTEFHAQKAGFVPKGADSGDAVNLAQFIIDNYSSQIVLPIFYPAAQAHRDVIPKALESQGFQLNVVVAYASEENENLFKKVKETLEDEQNLPDCFVFFSPSGVTAIENILTVDLKPYYDKIKFFAMGCATASRLKDLNLTVAGVATSPKPDSLLKLLKLYK